MIRLLIIFFFFWGTICQASNKEDPVSNRWDLNFDYYHVRIPQSKNVNGGLIVAEHGDLILEARYNYEAIDTGSVFAGKRFAFGETVKFNLIPMGGVLFGKTDGVAPGLDLNITWGILGLYSQNEFVFNFSGAQSDFFFTWTELNLYPTEWFHFGGVLLKFEVPGIPNELQKGIDLGFTYKSFSLTGYIFDIGLKSEFGLINFNFNL
jgi:hypothetical protein